MIMRFFGFERPAPEMLPQGLLPEIHPQEILKIDEMRYPYRSLARVFDKDHNVAFQPLEQSDGPDQGLASYRAEEVDQILQNLENSQVASLVAPSRAGKTEAVMMAEWGAFDSSQTLRGKTNGHFIDTLGTIGNSEEPNPEKARNALKRKIELDNELGEFGQVALLDEFVPDLDNHISMLEYLLEQNYKCVFTQGGFLSNDAKKSLIEPLSARLGISIPVTEMGIKPLNPKQILELYEGKARKKAEDSPEFNTLAKLSTNTPVPLHTAISLVNQPQITPEIVWKALNDRYSGIYSIKQIKEAAKRRQIGQYSQ